MKPMRTAFSVHAKKNNNKKIRQRKHLTKTKEFLISNSNTCILLLNARDQTLWGFESRIRELETESYN